MKTVLTFVGAIACKVSLNLSSCNPREIENFLYF